MSALSEQPGGDHYRALPIQPVEYIHRNNLGFIAGNLVKYATRAGHKGGRDGAISDLLKVVHYARLQLELEYGIKTAPYTVNPTALSPEFEPEKRREAIKIRIDDLQCACAADDVTLIEICRRLLDKTIDGALARRAPHQDISAALVTARAVYLEDEHATEALNYLASLINTQEG